MSEAVIRGIGSPLGLLNLHLTILIGYLAEAAEIMSSLIEGQANGACWWDFVASSPARTMLITNAETAAGELAASEAGNGHQLQSSQLVDAQGAGPPLESASTAIEATHWRELVDRSPLQIVLPCLYTLPCSRNIRDIIG
jgi:hypothetical protein